MEHIEIYGTQSQEQARKEGTRHYQTEQASLKASFKQSRATVDSTSEKCSGIFTQTEVEEHSELITIEVIIIMDMAVATKGTISIEATAIEVDISSPREAELTIMEAIRDIHTTTTMEAATTKTIEDMETIMATMEDIEATMEDIEATTEAIEAIMEAIEATMQIIMQAEATTAAIEDTIMEETATTMADIRITMEGAGTCEG